MYFGMWLFGTFLAYCWFFYNLGLGDVSLLMIGYGARSSCTTVAGAGVFFPSCGCFIFGCCRKLLAVVLKIAYNLLSYSIPLFP